MIILSQWNEQNTINRGGDSPIYRNLIEQKAFIKRGFDLDLSPLEYPEKWTSFTSVPKRVRDSDLPNLPKRTFLSPKGHPAEEFTIAFLIEADKKTMDYLDTNTALVPGVFLGYLGENWEIYFNGTLVRREMHLDEKGQIKSGRSWRDVSFPLDSSLFVYGTNILTMRFVGDPTFGVTGFYYSSPYYIDDYQIINHRQKYVLILALCGIFGFIGLYYLILFLAVRTKQEIYNLYYSIFSFLLCVYCLTRNGIINFIVPNSNVSIRMEFFALFVMVPVLGLFIEEIIKRKTTIISWGILGVYFLFGVTQIFFCNEYGAELLKIWSVTVLLYFSYVFFYDIIYFYFKNRSEKKKQKGKEEKTSSTFMLNIIIGSVLVYLCGIFDVLDTLIFHNSFGLFLYSTFVFHLGITFTLSVTFQRMNRAINVFGRFINKEIAEMAMDEHIKPGGTPKHATIFFSDIRNFTEKSEIFTKKFGDEASDKIVFWLNDYLSRMVECVEKTGGTIDKFMGDAVMAHWGTATTSGNLRKDAFNCVWASLLMRDAVLDMNRNRKPGDEGNPMINIGCGINTGVVTAGQIGSDKRMEYTVIGDPVNLASRVEALNKPFGTDILISESTWNLIKEYIIYEEMPAVKVKGKEKPVRIFAVINIKAATGGPKTLEEVRKMMGIKAQDRRSSED